MHRNELRDLVPSRFGLWKPIQYTPAGKEELERAISEYRRALERAIAIEKFVPGEEVVEATASDVQKAKRRARSTQSGQSYPLTKKILALYTWLGVILIPVGLFYPALEPYIESLAHNRTQRLLLAIGISLLGVGFAARSFFAFFHNQPFRFSAPGRNSFSEFEHENAEMSARRDESKLPKAPPREVVEPREKR